MSNAIVLQYVGFETRGAVREYTFTRRGSGGESFEYFVTIANAAFVAHRVRYQDAPDICSLRLHHEFATRSDHLRETARGLSTRKLLEWAYSPCALQCCHVGRA